MTGPPTALAVVAAGVLLAGAGPQAAAPVAAAEQEDQAEDAALAMLDRAVAAAATVPLRGRLVVASFGQGGPQVTALEVARRADRRLRVTRQEAWELGRDDDGDYLRSPRTGTLLKLGGVERRSFDRDRFLANYVLGHGGGSDLDTGPAQRLLVTARHDGVLRETLHVDEATGLVVRRETYDEDGNAVRVVAYTALEVDPSVRALARLDGDGLAVESVALQGVERQVLLERGIPVEATLPGRFDLVGIAEVDSVSVETIHLEYSDGLYTLSVYVQVGRLATKATRDAVALALPGGGTVWRWPGSEPRRVVWTGDGRTFTALTDAPTSTLLTAVSGLPNDPAPSTLRRVARGLARVLDHLLPPWDRPGAEETNVRGLRP